MNISVIIPVYGVEKYIERCARSLFSQTLQEGIEFLFIDDCTPDDSMQVLRQVLAQYPHRQSQTQLLRMPQNSGSAVVRQFGIQMAKGEYVICCDSDDWVEVSMYECMLCKAQETQADLVICDFASVSDSTIIETFQGLNPASKETCMNQLFHAETWSMVNKLVKKDLYQHIVFPTANMGEDLATTLQLTYWAKQVSYVPQVFYYYCYNPTSLTRAYSEEHILKMFRQFCANVQLLSDASSHYDPAAFNPQYLVSLKLRAKNRLLPLLSTNPDYYKLWRDTFPEINRQVLTCKIIPLRKKLRFLLNYAKSMSGHA